ncbi:MAG TPA: hypothetical protein EYP67_07825 [Methanosarcinales archaeon]|nr:hypothetical protein [Methanosarcinales archaeon]
MCRWFEFNRRIKSILPVLLGCMYKQTRAIWESSGQRKIQWIIREMDRGKSSSSIAAMQQVSQRRVQQLYKQYKDTGEISVLQKRGRKKWKVNANEESIILDAYE